MKRLLGIVLATVVVQAICGELTIINGAEHGDFTWWQVTLISGLIFSTGLNLIIDS
jgi:hypothetical protein